MEFSNHRSSTIVNRDSRDNQYFPSPKSHSNPEYFSKKKNSVTQEDESNSSNAYPTNSDTDPVLKDEIITNDQEHDTYESVVLDSPKKTDPDKKYAPQPEDPDQDSTTDDEDIYVDVEHMPSNTAAESPIDEYSGKDVEESDPIDNPSLY